MNLPALPALPATPCAAAPGMAPKSADEPGAARFARLLESARDDQSAETAPPDVKPDAPAPRAAAQGKTEGQNDASDAAAPSPTDGASDDTGDAANEPQADSAPVDARPRLRTPGLPDRARKDAPRASALAIVDTKVGTPVAADAAAVRDSESKQAGADIASLLPGWTCALPLPPALDKAAGTPADGADRAEAGELPAPAARGLARAALAHDEAALRRDARAASEAMGATATTLPAHAQGAAPAREASAAALEAATPHGRELEPAIGSPAPAASAALSTLARPDAIVTTAHVAAPIDTPAFAPALATQVRWLAQERVQQAQITLNPAGMGPVAVQIVLDGANARVDFSAEQAATRHAIEASLPVLAAALDESGLKLSGGGVHDSAGRQQPGWNAPAAQHASKLAFESDKGVRDIGAPPRASIGRGLVDLVA